VRLTASEQFVALVGDETGPAFRTLEVRRGSKVQTFNVPAGRLGVQFDVIKADPTVVRESIDRIWAAPLVEAPRGK